MAALRGHLDRASISRTDLRHVCHFPFPVAFKFAKSKLQLRYRSKHRITVCNACKQLVLKMSNTISECPSLANFVRRRVAICAINDLVEKTEPIKLRTSMWMIDRFRTLARSG